MRSGHPPEPGVTAGQVGFVNPSEAFTYTGGRWGYTPSDLGLYQHGSIQADVAAAKAQGYCGAS